MKNFYLIIALFSCVFSPLSHATSVSHLLITEIMANPTAVSDTNGEWFELFNPTAESIDLSGTILSDDNSLGHVITSGIIEAGSYFVMARNGDSSINGGFTADYTYSRFTLGNTSDQIILRNSNAGEILRLDYGAGFVPSGGSMELIDAVMLPDNYAATTTTFGDGDFGTPGEAGSFIQPTASPVPVPAAAWLMGSGLLGLVGFSRRQQA